MNWHEPWDGPRAFQYALYGCAGVLGFVLLSPWWRDSWQAWDDATQTQAQLLAQQERIQALRTQTKQLQSTPTEPPLAWADAAVLTQLAQRQGLQSSWLGVDPPPQSPTLHALHMQQWPVRLNVQGAWEGWLQWLAQWPVVAPGVTVSQLELQADPRGGVAAHVVVLTPQSTTTPTLGGARKPPEGTNATDPFNAHDWASAQRLHAEQHPSYTRWVVPELRRPRDVLETFPRERLQYVGQIASGAEVQALVKVLPLTDAKKEPLMMSVHRVRVGHHLGQDFGKVLAVQSDHLVLQELALTPTGEWQPREVRLPLQGVAP